MVGEQRIDLAQVGGMRVLQPAAGGAMQIAALRKRQQAVGDLLRDDVLELIIVAVTGLARMHQIKRDKALKLTINFSLTGTQGMYRTQGPAGKTTSEHAGNFEGELFATAQPVDTAGNDALDRHRHFRRINTQRIAGQHTLPAAHQQIARVT